MNEREYVALVGAPNCGKTTLFNALTGLHQTVGNYPGVTVEKKMGMARTTHGETFTLIDLPGTYSMVPSSLDEQVTRDVLLNIMGSFTAPDTVLLVTDAAALHRQMPFILQVIELGLPTILILNRIDLAERKGIIINIPLLSEKLGGIKIIVAQANTGRGLIEIRQAIIQKIPTVSRLWQGDDDLEEILQAPIPPQILETNENAPNYTAQTTVALLSDPQFATQENLLPPSLRLHLHQQAEAYKQKTHLAIDETISLIRIAKASEIYDECITHKSLHQDDTLTAKLDKLFLHPILGWIFFALFFFLMFWGVFTGGTLPSQGLEWIALQLQKIVTTLLGQGMLCSLINNGIIDGVFGVLSFLPQILILFLILGIMESSGYMARAAYLLDGIMRKAGLPGKSFIPLLSGYACSLPGIMATRIIGNDKDRLLTMLVLPWMSCSARLIVYSLLISVLFTAAQLNTLYQGIALFLLYILGTLSALMAARLLRPSVTKEAPALLLLELPTYQWPDFTYIGHMLLQRGGIFVKRMTTIVTLFSIILWGLTHFPKNEESPQHQAETSYIAQISKTIEPAFAPIGYDWRITSGLLSSFVAREMFNSHMSILFSSSQNATKDTSLDKAFEKATWPDGKQLFSPATCISILIFYVYALQCFSTIALIRKETNSFKWPLFQVLFMTGFAYIAAWLAYRITLLLT